MGVTTYDRLAADLKKRYLELRKNEQYWIGLAGNPGSGKSTLAEALLKRLDGLLTVIPLDGFHYYREELDDMEDVDEAYARRGAPFTFNAEKFVSVIKAAHREGKGTFPDFDHRAGDPVEHAIALSAGPQVVLVEGNYVLLSEQPWEQLQSCVFDETWFLDIPFRRVIGVSLNGTCKRG